MEYFEIHITGDESIIEKAKSLNLKTITINLLNPDKSVLRTEYMTSIRVKFDNYEICRNYVKDISNELRNMGVNIIREKIETPYYEHYKNQSLYMESHFVNDEMKLPTSRNVRKKDLLATDRTYNLNEYDNFKKQYSKEGVELELCLFDTFVEEDLDWFVKYQPS